MKISDFDFYLPDNLIAKEPIFPKDHSRLLIMQKKSGGIGEDLFFNIFNYLNNDDILVVNNSKVFLARLFGRKENNGNIEILLTEKLSDSQWLALGKRISKNTQKIIFENNGLEAKVVGRKGDQIELKFNLKGTELERKIEQIGRMPLPPYIKRNAKKEDNIYYQTVYAKELGSIAAPTAGLHFTKELITKLKASGMTILETTLHVGLGTFAPIRTENISEHEMHSEYFSLDKNVYNILMNAKKRGRRIIAVGTTTARVLESVWQMVPKLSLSCSEQSLDKISGRTNIFIYPGHKFQCIDGLITNFHLPKSSLILLVSAFAGQNKIKKAYQYAITNNFRFYSYGDAMLII